MMQKLKSLLRFGIPRLFAPPLAVLAFFSGCADVEVVQTDVPAYDGPTVEFDPSGSVIPFPNNLLIDPSKGVVSIPTPCTESEIQRQLRVGVLNTLDGFGTYEPALQVTFTETIDADTLAGHVHLFEFGGSEIPVATFVGQSTRANSDCTASETVTSLTIVPVRPLSGATQHVVALTEGIATPDGVPIIPSVTWALVRQSVNPITVVDGVVVAERTPLDLIDDATALLGIHQLWNALAPTMAFLDDALGSERNTVLIAWEFRTQTTTAPLDPRIAGSLASMLPANPLAGVASITGPNSAEEFLEEVLGVETCTAIGCENVGDVLGGTLSTPNYQAEMSNMLPGGAAVPGPWSNPTAPELVSTPTLPFLALVPTTPAPAGGYPVVVFGHGLTRSRTDLFAIGPQLASAGVASIAIDWVAHGARAVQTSDDPSLGCAGAPDPSLAPQCFAPLLATNLAAARDNLRQSALDTIGLIGALRRCLGATCNPLVVDPDRIGYLGHSLGGLLGSVVASAAPEVRVAVLNVGGVGWVDVVENTAALGIRCPLVDALIAAGVINGQVSDLTATPPTGTCLGDTWKVDPGWLVFANIGRWILDPGDGANFVSLFGDRPVLVQEAVDDKVIPNIASERLGALLGATTAQADSSVSPTTVSAAITVSPTARKLVRYTTQAADPSTGFPGNSYGNSSLLAPVSADTAGQLGTALMQRDAITYLLNNL
jgi:pimeloyl-ACP methyl ester carboxylesterase